MKKTKETPPVESYIARHKDLLVEKDPWNIHFQSLAEIFLTRKQNFTHTIAPGEFLQDNVFNNTGQFAAYTMASVFLSMMWPDAARTFTVRPVRRLRGVPGVEEYFRFVNDEMQTAMDNPRAGLVLALMEHFLDQAVFGTSGVGAFEGPDDDPSMPVIYDAWGVKSMCITENAQGYVDTIFMCRQRTCRQVVEEYGEDSVSPKIRETIKSGKPDDKVDVLVVIEPKEPDMEKIGVAAMAYRTVHIDIKNKFLMRESGYSELPVFVARMFKTLDETYGRSPAMTALPDMLSLNGLSEAVLVAAEKQLDPPLAVLESAVLGGGVVDTSAGALNVFAATGRLSNEKPIFPLYTVGEFQSIKELKEQLTQSIMQSFFLDRLLDLNNQTQMTAFETSVRNRMRGESLGAMFARQEKEVITPLIERTFNIMYRKGLLGIVADRGLFGKAQGLWNKILGAQEQIVPEVVVAAAEKGLDVFEIEYISPAKRFQQSEKLQGIFSVLETLPALAGLPGALDNVDSDKMVAELIQYSGAPKHILRTRAEVDDVRARGAQQQQAGVMLEAAKGISEVARNGAQAQAAITPGAQRG